MTENSSHQIKTEAAWLPEIEMDTDFKIELEDEVVIEKEPSSVSLKTDIKEEIDDCLLTTEVEYSIIHIKYDTSAEDESKASQKNLVENKRKTRKLKAKEKSYPCDICGSKCLTPSALKLHKIRHLKIKPFACNSCDKTFPKLCILENHKKLRHLGIKSFSCPFCEKTFSTPYCLKHHKNMHLGIKAFSCNICDKTFGTRQSLSRHKTDHFIIKQFQCSYCDKKFGSESDLERHQYVHRGSRIYDCNSCDVSFKSLDGLNVHKKIHSNIMPFACNICEESFTEITGLQFHMRIHERINSSCQVKLNCSFCSETFLELRYLKQHTKNMHVDKEPFRCDCCGLLFDTSYELIEHSKTEHLGN